MRQHCAPGPTLLREITSQQLGDRPVKRSYVGSRERSQPGQFRAVAVECLYVEGINQRACLRSLEQTRVVSLPLLKQALK